MIPSISKSKLVSIHLDQINTKNVDEETICDLFKNENCVDLEKIKIYNSRIESRELISIKILSNWVNYLKSKNLTPKLKSLDLCYNNLNDDDIKAIYDIFEVFF